MLWHHFQDWPLNSSHECSSFLFYQLLLKAHGILEASIEDSKPRPAPINMGLRRTVQSRALLLPPKSIHRRLM